MAIDWVAEKKKQEKIKKDLDKYDSDQRLKNLERTKKLGQEQGKTDVVAVASKQINDIKYPSGSKVSSGNKSGKVVEINGQKTALLVGEPEPAVQEIAEYSVPTTTQPKSYNTPDNEKIKTYSDTSGKIIGIEDPITQTSMGTQGGSYFDSQQIKKIEQERAAKIEAPVQKIVQKEAPVSNRPSAYEQRIKDLMQREQKFEAMKHPENLGIADNPNEAYLVRAGKAAARFPFEYGAFIPVAAGRAALVADTLIHGNPEGKEELNRALRDTPRAVAESLDPRNPNNLINIAMVATAVKMKASNPPKFIQQQSKGYTPIEDVGFKVTPSTTQSYEFNEYLKIQDTKITGIHTSFENLFGKSIIEKITKPLTPKTEVQVKAFPEQSKGFRKSIEQFSLFKSLPVKESIKKVAVPSYERIAIKEYSKVAPKGTILKTDTLAAVSEKVSGYKYTKSTPQAYGAYIGIFDESAITSPPKIKYSFGEPKRYAYVFKGETIEALSPVEKTGMQQGGVKGGKAIMEYQRAPQSSGKSFLAAENLVKKSVEGQYVSPEGSIIRKASSGSKFTIYTEPSKLPVDFLRKLQDTTGFGLKSSRIDIIDVETVPGKSVMRAADPFPRETRIEASRPVKSVAIKSLPVMSMPVSVSSKPSIANIFSYPKPSSPSKPVISSSLFVSPSKPSSPNRSVSPSSPSKPSSPSVLSFPSTPRTPSTPSKPILPSNPSTPSKPSSPSVPSIPSFPSYPSKPNKPSSPNSPMVNSPPSDSIWDFFPSRQQPRPKLEKFRNMFATSKQYKPTLKSLLFGESGKAPVSGALTGLENRVIPKIKKKRR